MPKPGIALRERFALGCRRHPLLAASIVAVAGIAGARFHVGWGVGIALVLALAALATLGARYAAAWLVCGTLAAGNFIWRVRERDAAEREILAAGRGKITARVLQDARGSSRFWTCTARISSGAHRGATVWWEGRGELPVAGASVRANGDFHVLPAPRNLGEFDRAAWLRERGVAAVFRATDAETRVSTGHWARRSAAIRAQFREGVTAGLDGASAEAKVIRAVVIGERPTDADALIEDFRNSGTLHVFSVSGLHVAMVGTLGWLALGWLRVPRRVGIPMLLPLMFGYAWITGFSQPAVRAAWMGALFLGAFIGRRRPDLLNALGGVLLMVTLWDGRLVFQPGVQLSYGVVAAIAVGAGWATKAFAWMAVPEPYLPGTLMSGPRRVGLALRRKLSQSLGVSLAAGIGSTPLTWFHFGLFTPISILAGTVLVPVVFVLLALSLVATAVFPIVPSVARGLNRVNFHVARATAYTAEQFAAVPGGHLQATRENQPVLLIYDLDHGAGAACFTEGNGSGVMIDCGDPRGFRRTVAPSLRNLGIAPDAAVLTHPDGRHLGGGSAVWTTLPIRQALLPVRWSRSPAMRSWVDQAPEAGLRVRLLASGESLPFPGHAELDVLNTADPQAVNQPADERVAVLRLRWNEWKILFTSDAGVNTEACLLKKGSPVAADVIIAGRNRADLSLTDAFLDAVRPQVIVASNAGYPSGERLNPATVAYWKSRGIMVIDQAVSGGVALRVEPSGDLRIEGFLNPPPLVLKRPRISGSATSTSVCPRPPTVAGNPSSDEKTSPHPKEVAPSLPTH